MVREGKDGSGSWEVWTVERRRRTAYILRICRPSQFQDSCRVLRMTVGVMRRAHVLSEWLGLLARLWELLSVDAVGEIRSLLSKLSMLRHPIGSGDRPPRSYLIFRVPKKIILLCLPTWETRECHDCSVEVADQQSLHNPRLGPGRRHKPGASPALFVGLAPTSSTCNSTRDSSGPTGLRGSMQGVCSSAGHLVPSLPSTSKRNRSSSPGGPARSAKKRALWTTGPPLLNNAQSSEVDRSSAPWSGRISASAIDWVSMTESLYLATPPAEPTEPITFDEPAQVCHRPHHPAVLVEERRRVEEGDDDDDDDPWEADEHEHHDGMAVDNDHEMTGTEPTYDQSQTPHRQDHYATAHPHQAPPLYDHLAGSPSASTSSSFAMLNPMGTSMSRWASNSSSDHSSSLYPTFDSNRIQRQPTAHQMDTGSDTAHANHPHHRPAPATSMNTAKRAEPVANGWKMSMGYRADCEKCVMRVPGHYLHCHDGR